MRRRWGEGDKDKGLLESSFRTYLGIRKYYYFRRRISVLLEINMPHESWDLSETFFQSNMSFSNSFTMGNSSSLYMCHLWPVTQWSFNNNNIFVYNCLFIHPNLLTFNVFWTSRPFIYNKPLDLYYTINLLTFIILWTSWLLLYFEPLDL